MSVIVILRTAPEMRAASKNPPSGTIASYLFSMTKHQVSFCRSMRLKSPAPSSPKFRLGADSAAGCAKRDERQFSKAAQTKRCPMPDAFLVGYTEERAKDGKKLICVLIDKPLKHRPQNNPQVEGEGPVLDIIQVVVNPFFY